MTAVYFSIALSLSATIIFSISAVLFRKVSEFVSAFWMNFFKALVAFVSFGLASIFVSSPWNVENSLTAISWLTLSGFLGLGVGDLFLLKAFTLTGTTRAFLVFRTQPVVLAIGAWIFLRQALSVYQGMGIFFLLLCVFVLSLEDLKRGSWRIQGTFYALIGATLDATGVVMTRQAFDIWPELHVLHANFYRVIGALVAFVFISRFEPLRFFEHWKSMPGPLRLIAIIAGFTGTFVSLVLWLKAVSLGHLATIAAVGGLGPMFVMFFEAVIYKQKPSPATYVAVVLSIVGMYFILRV